MGVGRVGPCQRKGMGWDGEPQRPQLYTVEMSILRELLLSARGEGRAAPSGEKLKYTAGEGAGHTPHHPCVAAPCVHVADEQEYQTCD